MSAENLPIFALPDDSVVEIQGDPTSVHKALELIATHLRKFLVDRSVIGIFESQVSSLVHLVNKVYKLPKKKRIDDENFCLLLYNRCKCQMLVQIRKCLLTNLGHRLLKVFRWVVGLVLDLINICHLSTNMTTFIHEWICHHQWINNLVRAHLLAGTRLWAQLTLPMCSSHNNR